MASYQMALPPLVPFPEAVWREHLVPEEWEACLDAWILLAGAHLSLSSPDFVQISAKDESLTAFLTSFAREPALSHDKSSLSDSSKFKEVRKQSYLLCFRLLDGDQAPKQLLQWEFLADINRMYGRNHGSKLMTVVFKRHSIPLESSMGLLKASLTKELDAGLKGDLKTTELQLKKLNHLLHVSPEAAAFFMAGSDFLDSLISCYKLMNPQLRNAIVSTTYLCLIGLTEGKRPQFSSLIDQFYSLKSAAEAHNSGPTNVNNSLVAELVTVTPILKQVQQRIDASGSGSSRAKSILAVLDGFRKAGDSGRPQRLVKHKINKGKGMATYDGVGHVSQGQIHIHRISLISQVQDLFPDLGSGFVVKLLDEYRDDVEQVIAHVLEESLPAYLKSVDRSEELEPNPQVSSDYAPGLEPRSTSPQTPVRRGIFDDDDFDRLAVETSRLHFGPRNPGRTADDDLKDRSNAPNKAAILSALAAFDSDDDERDDTYDIEDVGGTIDSVTPGNNPEEADSDVRDAHDEALFKAYKMAPGIFDRDTATRRGKPRMALKEETGMTDEAIEGWGLMLSRDQRQMRRLQAVFSTFQGGQKELAPTAWRASPAGSGTEDSDIDSNNRGRGGFRGRGGRAGRGRGRGNAAGPIGEKDTESARHRKEANKGSRANHNRRDQRAKKMARGGFPG